MTQNATTPNGRRLRLGVIGGGEGSVIGRLHRCASLIDGKYDLVAGAFDLDADRGRRFAQSLLVPTDRIYDDYQQFIRSELDRDDPVDMVCVLTPNASHYEIASNLVEAGLNVFCEKPLTTRTEDAEDLVKRVKTSSVLFGVNYGYSGYPMVRQAREMVRYGELGRIRVIQTEFAFGIPATLSEDPHGHWRTKPGGAGPSATVGMMGTHALHLATFIGGVDLHEVSADFSTFVSNRVLEDDANINMRFSDGVRGAMWSSYVAAGAYHGLRIRIHGEDAGLEWCQECPEQLVVMYPGRERRVLTRGSGALHDAAQRVSRLPAGLPEGFIEAVANIYGDMAEVLWARMAAREPDPLALQFPDVIDGAKGVRFVGSAVESAHKNGAWTDARIPTTLENQ